MTTIDNIMALALNYRLAGSASRDEHEEALRTALTEAITPQPVRDPLQDALAWELWLNAVDTANNTGRLVAYTYKAAIERAHGIGDDK